LFRSISREDINTMKKQNFKEQNLREIIASYSQELDKNKNPCIDKYLKDFTGDKDKLIELLKTVELIHNFSKKSKKPSTGIYKAYLKNSAIFSKKNLKNKVWMLMYHPLGLLSPSKCSVTLTKPQKPNPIILQERIQ